MLAKHKLGRGMTSFKRNDDTLRRLRYGDHPPACTCVKCTERRNIAADSTRRNRSISNTVRTRSGAIGNREEIKMQRAYASDEMAFVRNRLVIIIIVFVALAIMNSQAFKFPHATDHLIGHFYIGNAIKTTILLIMLLLVMPLRDYLRMVVSYYMHTGYKYDEHADSKEVARNIAILANGLTNIVAIGIAWTIVVALVNQLILIEGSKSLDWLDIIFNVSFAMFLTYMIIITIGSFPTVLGIKGKKSKKKPCPNCGTSNLPGAKFCVSCGAAINSAQKAPVSSRCTKCGTENKSGAKFCENCGGPLVSSSTEV